ncbi:MAG: hypothetical protein P4N59_05485 [Negativicutes bacterium]|nr:hypothetical protein [Negativicutes bacterium]
MAEVLDYIKRSHEAEKEFHQTRTKELHIEKNNLEGRLNRLTDLLIEGHIDDGVYKQKRIEMRQRILELGDMAKETATGNLNFKEALSNILILMSKSYDLFESSKTDEKRKLLGFVFSNLQLEGATLRYTLKKPFDLMAQLPNNPEWRAEQDRATNWELYLPINPSIPMPNIKPLKKPSL